METLKIGINWIDDVLSEGLPIKSTTVITGPGGSGKPLIGEIIVSTLLKKERSVIIISLQYPGSKFVTGCIKRVTELYIKQYKKK